MSNYLFCVFSSPTDRWTSTTTLVSSNSVYGFSRISLLLTNLINLLPQFPPDPSLRPHLPCSGTVSYYKKGFPSVKPSTSSPKLLNLLGVDFLEKDSVYLDEYSSSYIGCVNTESSYFSSIKVQTFFEKNLHYSRVRKPQQLISTPVDKITTQNRHEEKDRKNDDTVRTFYKVTV